MAAERGLLGAGRGMATPPAEWQGLAMADGRARLRCPMTEHADPWPADFDAFRRAARRFLDRLAADRLLSRIEREAAAPGGAMDRPIVIEGELSSSSERRLVIGYFASGQRDLADVVREGLGFRDEAFGVGNVGPVRITIERLRRLGDAGERVRDPARPRGRPPARAEWACASDRRRASRRTCSIGGELAAGALRRTLAVDDPSTGEPLCTVADGDEADAGDALARRRRPAGWAGRPPRERARVLRRAADALLAGPTSGWRC